MAQDINKHLERARKSLEKNKLREAVTEYQAVLEEAPAHQEALQALADIFTRLNEPALAAEYYGIQFDRLVETGDGAKASAVFIRFLRTFPQPADRLMRFATLLQKQNRTSEAIEQFGNAAELYAKEQRGIEALACYESMAVLDPENPQRHIVLGEMAEKLRHADLAARSYVRAGQLTLSVGALDEALEYFGRAQVLAPQDRTGALLFGEAKLRKGDAEGAVMLLEPFAATERDAAFQALYGEALLRAGRLDAAREFLQAYYAQKPEGFVKLFELAAAYIRAGQDAKAAALLVQTKETMRALRKEVELSANLDRLAATYPQSLPLAEVVAKLYEELNRETKYFDSLVKLFDLYLGADRLKEACESLDRLVDIDPYDYRNHERIAKLEGKADPGFLQNILARAAKAATVSTRTDGFTGAGREPSENAAGVPEEVRAQQALEDLVVQVEIFLQYSLQSKAVERLERIAELFPGEEERNERLRALYERANWWPKGAGRKPSPQSRSTGARTGRSSSSAAAAGATTGELRNDVCAHGGGNASRPRGHRGNQSFDVPAANAARSAGDHRGGNRKASARQPLPGRRGRSGGRSASHGGIRRAGIRGGRSAKNFQHRGNGDASDARFDGRSGIAGGQLAGLARIGSGIGAGRDADGQGNAGAFRGVADRRRARAKMEAERKLFSAGGGRSVGDVSKSHAAAFAGAFAGGGGRKDRSAEPRSVY